MSYTSELNNKTHINNLSLNKSINILLPSIKLKYI